ncbi:Arm DNA-binding domain-containing protein [Ammoniphilus sp. 3BR4]|uniref:Arm DNA-binding domain-containing protein n=1 Tax=Ammoniphilus sp. 3BR4 TaxID=3158265 RepID=UPI0034654C3A
MAKYDKRIKQADNGTYYFVISAGRYESGAKKGKRRQILRKSFKTKREAHEALVEIEYAVFYSFYFLYFCFIVTTCRKCIIKNYVLVPLTKMVCILRRRQLCDLT